MWFMGLLLASLLAGCLGDKSSSGTQFLDTAKAISVYSLADNTGTMHAGTINEAAKIIAVTVPYGTNKTALVATFTHNGASVAVGTKAQESATTPNDFTSSVAYLVTAPDGTTTTYSVMVTEASTTDKALTAFSLNGVAGTITEATKAIAVTMPFGTDVTGLIATFTTSGTSVKVASITTIGGSTSMATMGQTSGTTTNNFSSPVRYIVTATNSTTVTYTVTVTVAASNAAAITSFSLGGIAGIVNETTKTISVTMPYLTDLTIGRIATYLTTGSSVTVGGTGQTSGTTMNVFNPSVTYIAHAADGSTTASYIVTVTVATNNVADITSFSLDGIAGVISGANISVVMPYGTVLTATPRTATFLTTGTSVTIGAPGVTQTSGITTNVFSSAVTYVVHAADGTTLGTYIVTVTVATSTAAAITSFSLDGIAGVVTGTNIAVVMPSGTVLTTAKTATYLTTGTSVTVAGTAQTSGATTNVFNPSVTYIVHAANGSTTATYTVTVTVAASTAAAITSFSLDGIAGVVTGTNIAVVLPAGTVLTTPIAATFLTTGTSVTVTGAAQTSGATTNVFNPSVTYVVHAADNTTTATYTVTATVAASTAAAITSFSLDGIAGVVSGSNISVVMPYGTLPTAAKTATFLTSGASVTVGGATQTSGGTTNVFNPSVTYVVHAGDGTTTANYIVTATVATSSAAAITSFSLDGIAGVVTESTKTIAVIMPSGTDLTIARIATYLTTGTSVTIVATPQTSGVTTNIFTAGTPKVYIVHAANGSTTVSYNVNVSVLAGTSVLPGLAGTSGANVTNPTVISANPSNLDTNVPTSTNSAGNVVTGKLLIATFNAAMDPTTINSNPPGTLMTFSLMTTTGSTNVPGTVAMNAANTIATFTPSAALTANTNYTATVSIAAKSAGGVAMPKPVVWSFTTNATPLIGQAAINLLTAGHFAILTKTGITDVPASAITGDIGSSPITGAAMNTVPCAEVTGFIYEVDAGYTVGVCANVLPTDLTVGQSVADMQAAYTDAAGRTAGVGPFLNLGAGTVTAQTLAPGVYTWGTPVSITGDITLNGTANDVWIFQLASTLDTAKQIILAGNAQAKNVFWVVASTVSLAATAQFTGVVLAQTNVALVTGASVSGRLLAQTAVTLQANTITQPAQ
jgi:hypothetical protein